MLGQKKRNLDPTNNQSTRKDDGGPVQPSTIPALRTFRLQRESGSDEIIEAHELQVDAQRMLAFVVYYFYMGDPTKPANATKLLLNADSWVEVEEINAAFPATVNH